MVMIAATNLRVSRPRFFEFELAGKGHPHAVALLILWRMRQAMDRWKAKIKNFSAM